MAHPQEEQVFQAYLKQIEAGEPADMLLADPAGALRPELESAEWLAKQRPQFEPRPGFIGASRKRLIARLDSPARPRQNRWLAWWTARPPKLWNNPVLQAVFVVFMLGLLFQNGLLLTRALPTWLPGDRLYGLKTLSEDVALVVASTPAPAAHWQIELAQRRLLEVQGLAMEGRYEQIPTTMDAFNRNVYAAVGEIYQVARQDKREALYLARKLQMTVDSQNQVMAVLAETCPESTRQRLETALAAAENNLLSMQKLFDPTSGEADILILNLTPPQMLSSQRSDPARVGDATYEIVTF